MHALDPGSGGPFAIAGAGAGVTGGAVAGSAGQEAAASLTAWEKHTSAAGADRGAIREKVAATADAYTTRSTGLGLLGMVRAWGWLLQGRDSIDASRKFSYPVAMNMVHPRFGYLSVLVLVAACSALPGCGDGS